MIDKLDISQTHPKWVSVSFSRNNFPIRLLNCGIVNINKNEILFLGEERNKKKKIIAYNFLMSTFKEKNIYFNKEDESWKFKESNFIYIGNKFFGQFDDSYNFIYYTFNFKETCHIINLE